MSRKYGKRNLSDSLVPWVLSITLLGRLVGRFNSDRMTMTTVHPGRHAVEFEQLYFGPSCSKVKAAGTSVVQKT